MLSIQVVTCDEIRVFFTPEYCQKYTLVKATLESDHTKTKLVWQMFHVRSLHNRESKLMAVSKLNPTEGPKLDLFGKECLYRKLLYEIRHHDTNCDSVFSVKNNVGVKPLLILLHVCLYSSGY